MSTVRMRGLSLVEVMIVMAILALGAGLVGPRIGAGMTRLEIRQAEETLRSLVQTARTRARRADRAHFVVMDRPDRRILVLDPDMRVLAERELPSSIEFLAESEGGISSIYVPPSGLLRQPTIFLKTRLGTSEVRLR